MGTINGLWGGIVKWADGLSKAESAILGAVGMATLTGIGKYIVVPLGRGLVLRVGRLLYPLLSGAIVFDRFWSLPLYLRNVAKYVGRLRNPWLAEGQQLSDIFVPVSATTGVPGVDRLDLKEVFARYRHVVLVGEPGSGKSTGLRALALDCISGRLKSPLGRRFVPVYIELRAFAESGKDIGTYVVEIFRANGFPRPWRTIKRLVAKGQLVYLLDGLDEVDGLRRGHVLDQVRLLLARSVSDLRYHVILTSRPTGYNDQLRDLVDETFLMADFAPADIRRFVDNWEFRPPKSAATLLRVLAQRPRILAICRNPLMLTIVTSLYKETDYQLPDSREEFFRVCIDALLRRWDEARELDKRNKYAPGLKEAFLQELAFGVLSQGYLKLDGLALEKEVESFLGRRQRASDDGGRFVDELLQSGLLGRLPTGEVYFAHKTFAEAFAAAYLRSKPWELTRLWSERPDAWLEVCSLFVSDFRSSVDAIRGFLSNARKREDWSGLLILAGEAHICPEEEQAWIFGDLLKRSAVWDGLERRSIAAIARFGSQARSTLTLMFEGGTDGVRENVIYALSHVQEQWAIDLIVSALSGGLRKRAIEAVTGMGEDALSIVAGIVEERAGDAVLMDSCIRIATALDVPAATMAISPLLWAKDCDVSESAALAIAIKLSDPAHRAGFDREIKEMPGVPDVWKRYCEALTRWALPWVDHRQDVVGRYCRLLQNLISLAHKSEAAWENLAFVPGRLLVPIMIEVAGRWHKTSDWIGPYERLAVKLAEDAGLNARVGLRSGIEAIYQGDPSTNRATWAKASDTPREDVEVSGNWAMALSALVTLSLSIPLVVAVWSGAMSIWPAVSVVVAVGAVAAYVAIDERELENVWFTLLISGVSTGVIRWAVSEIRGGGRQRRREVVVYSGFAFSGALFFLMAAASAVHLGGAYLACLIAPAVSGLVWVEPDEIIFLRRTNPLTNLRDAIDSLRVERRTKTEAGTRVGVGLVR